MPDRRRKRPRDPAQLAKLMIDIASATAIRLILKRSKARSAATSTMRCWSKYMSRLAKAKNATVPRDSLFQSRPVAIGAATSTMAAMKAADFQMLHAEDKTTGDLTTAMLSQNFEKSWSSQTQQRTRLNLRNLNSLFNRDPPGACTGYTRRKILRWYRKLASATASSSPTAWARKLPAPGVRWLSTKLPTSPPTSSVASGWKPTMPLMK